MKTIWYRSLIYSVRYERYERYTRDMYAIDLGTIYTAMCPTCSNRSNIEIYGPVYRSVHEKDMLTC